MKDTVYKLCEMALTKAISLGIYLTNLLKFGQAIGISAVIKLIIIIIV